MNIDVRYDEIKKIGNEILELASELEEVTTELNKITEILELNWIGIDATNYLQNLREQYLIGLKSLTEMINDNANYLLNVPKIYETFDINMVNNARKRDIDVSS